MILGLYLHTFSFISQFIIVVALKFKDFLELSAFFKDFQGLEFLLIFKINLRTFKVRANSEVN